MWDTGPDDALYVPVASLLRTESILSTYDGTRAVQAIQERSVFGILLDVVQHAPVNTRKRSDVLDDIAGSGSLFEPIVTGSVHPKERNTRLPERNESFEYDRVTRNTEPRRRAEWHNISVGPGVAAKRG